MAVCFYVAKYVNTNSNYTLSLHDALPICPDRRHRLRDEPLPASTLRRDAAARRDRDRKSTRLNSSHVSISYAVFCLKKKSWLWPVDAKGEPLKATSYMAVVFYVAKYVNKN